MGRGRRSPFYIMSFIRHIVRVLLGAIVFLWLLAFVLPRIPVVQAYLGNQASRLLSEKLGTHVSVGNVELRLPSRIIVDNLYVPDQQGKDLLRANRLSASIELLPLLDGQVRITSAQLFGMKAHLTQRDASSPLNCQFLIDSLKSKDTLSSTPLDLRIASLVIRNSALSYDRADVPLSAKGFSPYHLSITELSSHIKLNHLTDDTLNVDVKRLHLKEKSGLHLKHLTFSLLATPHSATLTELSLQLPQSAISSPHATISYAHKGDALSSFKHSLNLAGNVTLSDLTFLIPQAHGDDTSCKFQLTSQGTNSLTQAHLRLNSSLRGASASGLDANLQATLRNLLTSPTGDVKISRLAVSEQALRHLSSYGINLPQQVLSLGNVSVEGNASLLAPHHARGKARITTTRAGKADLTAEYTRGALTAHVIPQGINLAQITGDKSLGIITGDISLNSRNILNPRQGTSLSGTVKEFTYNNYTYHNARINGKLTGNTVTGTIDINDPNVFLHANGTADLGKKNIINADIDVQNFSPSRLHLTSALGNQSLNAHITVSPTVVQLTSDIADVNMVGNNINLSTLPANIMHIVAVHMPAAQRILPRNLGRLASQPVSSANDFTLNLRLKDPAVLKSFLPPSIEIDEEAILYGNINTHAATADLTLAVPTLRASGQEFNGTMLHLYTSDSTLHSHLTTDFMEQNGPVALSLHCEGKADHLHSVFSWDNQRANAFKGSLIGKAQFFSTPRGTAFNLAIPQSEFQIGDSLWTMRSNKIQYQDGIVRIENFHAGSHTQYININGTASANPADSLVCQLSNVDVSYILNLINFHSVEFGGMASGTLSAKGMLGDINASGNLDVANFLFEQGNLGTLHLNADYDNNTRHINLDGVCEEDTGELLLSGYISPSPGEIELDIQPRNTPLDFVQTFCSSFMKDSQLRGTGQVRLFGPFSNINLEGKIFASGAFTLTPTNCRYTLPGDTVTFIPDDIQFRDAVLKDKSGGTAYLTGGIHHEHLTHLSYDLYATTSRLLAYDFPQLQGEDTFCGSAIINGDIGIHGKDNDLVVNADATTLPGSYLIYNASSPDAIRSGDIITWRSATPSDSPQGGGLHLTPLSLPLTPSQTTNLHLNFFIHATPDAHLHLLMDETTGDYIDLFGSGDLRVNYFNKGGLDIFGNYITDHGLYKMTIQNLLRRDFTFNKGGTITFSGDPYNALLNMQAQYSINSVPLADLNIGNTLTANNVPVNCLMNITGTPGKPSIAFDLNLPSLSSDARQMVNSVINSEEEMNQQVLYLLAIGRFYAPSDINTRSSGTDTQRDISQGTLAVQSFLSGTISQQFNNVMSSVMGNLLGSGNTFTFGANIAPGNEGFSNAEYEGLLSGRLFNNRLLFNGQFGYRDNIKNNSQSFIGDFSLQYLLTKSGTISLKVYNQTNDRYFTRNSLNTQGIGVVFQKEFGK